MAILQGFAKLREREECHGREGGAKAWGAAPMRLPTIYIKVEGAGFLPSKSIGALAKVGERNPINSLPHRLLFPFLGILILSLWDMILFLLRGDLGAP